MASFDRIEPVVKKLSCRLESRLRQARRRVMACHGVISAGALTPKSLVGPRLRRTHFPTTLATAPNVFRVPSLDGGGAKGFYTLSALKEIEALVGCPLCEKFDLIYGTSTGAIIATLLGRRGILPQARRNGHGPPAAWPKDGRPGRVRPGGVCRAEVRRIQDRHGHRWDEAAAAASPTCSRSISSPSRNRPRVISTSISTAESGIGSNPMLASCVFALVPCAPLFA